MISLFPSRAIALQVGPLAIHWYGILYLCAFIITMLLLPRLQKRRGLSLSKEQWSELLTLGVAGVLLGGRIGFVALYEPLYFIGNPFEILAVWKGGMSSHGGFLGVALAIVFFARKHKISILALSDIIVIPAAIGLALGRVGNFINLELYGFQTDLPWGITIPGVEGARHPTQLYAVAKDLFIASMAFFTLSWSAKKGTSTAVFLMLYGILRFLIEFIRVPSHPPVDLGVVILTRGQFFTVPLLVAGILLFAWSFRKSQ